jgi:hypothetical protein
MYSSFTHCGIIIAWNEKDEKDEKDQKDQKGLKRQAQDL